VLPVFRVDHHVFGEREAQAVEDPAFELSLDDERVDGPADVVGGDEPLDSHLASLGVHGDLDEVRAEGHGVALVGLAPAPDLGRLAVGGHGDGPEGHGPVRDAAPSRAAPQPEKRGDA